MPSGARSSTGSRSAVPASSSSATTASSSRRAGATSTDAPFRRWEPHERRGLRFARGRVLDAGCGSGRVARELQRRGRDVIGIDISPLAIEAARRLGVRDARVLALADADAELGSFDSIVLLREQPRALEAREGAADPAPPPGADERPRPDRRRAAWTSPPPPTPTIAHRRPEHADGAGRPAASGSGFATAELIGPWFDRLSSGEDRARRAARGQRLASRSLSRRARRPLRRHDRGG